MRSSTLVTFYAVVAIVGGLAYLIVPNLYNAMQRARQKRTMADMIHAIP